MRLQKLLILEMSYKIENPFKNKKWLTGEKPGLWHLLPLTLE